MVHGQVADVAPMRTGRVFFGAVVNGPGLADGRLGRERTRKTHRQSNKKSTISLFVMANTAANTVSATLNFALMNWASWCL